MGSVPVIKFAFRFSVSSFVKLPMELGKASETGFCCSSTPMKLVNKSKNSEQTAQSGRVRISSHVAGDDHTTLTSRTEVGELADCGWDDAIQSVFIRIVFLERGESLNLARYSTENVVFA